MNFVRERIYISRQADVAGKWAIVVIPFWFALVTCDATAIGGLTTLLEFRTSGWSRRFVEMNSANL